MDITAGPEIKRLRRSTRLLEKAKPVEQSTGLFLWVQPPPNEKALANSIVVNGILKCLPIVDLKKCRLVSRFWLDESTRVLIKRNGCIIKCGNNDQVKPHRGRTLPDLEKLFNESKRLPSTNLYLPLTLLSKQVETNSFFSRHGRKITELTLDFDAVLMWKSFKDIVFQYLSHINHLRIVSNGRPIFFRDFVLNHVKPSNDASLLLPNLSSVVLDSFRLRRDDDFVRIIIEASPSLRAIDLVIPTRHASVPFFTSSFHDSQELVTFLRSLNKISLIKGYGVKNFSEPELTAVAAAKPRLSRLSFVEDFKIQHIMTKTYSDSISQILESSKESLESIVAIPPIQSLKFPSRLARVKSLELRRNFYYELNGTRLHPVYCSDLHLNSRFKFTFPNLEKLVLDITTIGENFEDIYPYPYPKAIDAVVSVKELRMKMIISAVWLRHFSRVFPNTQLLKMTWVTDFTETMNVLWSCFTKLQVLDFTLELCDLYKENAVSSIIDSAFTGFSLHTCSLLAAIPVEANNNGRGKRGKKNNKKVPKLVTENGIDLVRSRTGLGIRNLKDLQKLKIKFHESVINERIPNGEVKPMLTQVTGEYSFKKMKKLEIDLTLDCRHDPSFQAWKSLLEPWRPYVTSFPEKNTYFTI